MKELVTFDQVIVALKAGHHAKRVKWMDHHIMGSMRNGKCVGLLSMMNNVLGAAGLHPDDLLADDWEIIEQTATAPVETAK